MEVKIVMRQVGVPSADGSIISGEDFEQYLEFNYLSNGYKIENTSVMPIAGGLGFTIFMVLTREYEKPATVKAK